MTLSREGYNALDRSERDATIQLLRCALAQMVDLYVAHVPSAAANRSVRAARSLLESTKPCPPTC